MAWFRRYAWVAVAVCPLAACGPVKELEPNDDYSRSTVLSAGRAGKGRLGSASDVDWWRVEAPRDGILSVRVRGIRGVDWVLSVRSADRTEVKRVDETAVGGDEQALDLWLPKGELYLIISNKKPDASNPGQEYLLETKFETPSGREREPNDRVVAATPLEPGTPMRGRYYPSANPLVEDGQEEDWFVLRVDRPGLQLLNVDVSEVSRVDAILEIYDVNGYKVREADSGGVGDAESLRNFGVRGPAEYRFRLRAKGKAADAEVFYHLVTELVPYQGRVEFEPNDQRLEATPLEADAISGTIAPAGDVDWYRLAASTETKQLLRVEVSPAAGLDLELRVMDDVGAPVLVVDNMGREQPEILTGLGVRAEQYLVVAEKTGKKGDPRQVYTLSKTVTPWQAGLEYEANDSSGTAQEIKPGESVDGYHAPKGDVDWYEFNVYQKGAAVLELTGVLNVRARAVLFDQEYRELKAAEAAKAGESLSLELELEPGTYAARLQAVEPVQSNVRDKYTFRVRMR